MSESETFEPAPPPRKSRFGCVGCLVMALCGGVVSVILLCGGAYWAFFNTGMPLAWIEEALEESGDVEIEGLTGTINSGFKADSIRVRYKDEKWSEFKEVNFKFNGVSDLMSKGRLHIEEFSVASGTMHWHPASPAEVFQRTARDFNRAEPPPGVQHQQPQQQGEIRIDLIEFKDITLIDEVTGIPVHMEEFRLEKFRMVGTQVVQLDDISIKSDHLDLETLPSDGFPDARADAVSLVFRGTIRETMHERILKDISYEYHVCFDNSVKRSSFGSTFDGQLSFEAGRDWTTYEFNNCSPGDFISVEDSILPAEMNGTVPVEIAGHTATVTFSPDSTFRLGVTKFRVTSETLEMKEHDSRSPPITAETVDADPASRCEIVLFDESPWMMLTFKSDAEPDQKELMARVIFGKTVDELDESQQAVVDGILTVQAQDAEQQEPEVPEENAASDPEAAEPSDPEATEPSDPDATEPSDPETEQPRPEAE